MPFRRGITSPGTRFRSRTTSPVEAASPPAQVVVRPTIHSSTERAGILSRTLAPSSNIRLIIPARVRSKCQNDVVFIGQTFIELRELSESAQVMDPVARHDFGAQILAAKVISAKLEYVDVVDQILDQAYDETRYTIRGQEVDASHPPQVLVLTTAANEMYYVYAQDQFDDSTKFVFAKRHFLSGVSLSEAFGTRLAVDPESRALAVAPATSHFAIMSLKDLDEVKAEIDKWSPTSPKSFTPIKEQRFIQVDGYIQHMDFLQASAHAPTKVILLLVVAGRADTHILLYRWDTRRPLSELKRMDCSGQRLPTEDRFSCMLIPSSHSCAFTLVSETAMVQYDNLVSEQAKRVSFPLPYKDNRHRRWIQWQRLERHALHRESNDDLILVREDGVLEVFLINYQPSLKVGGSFSPGSLGIKVDTAFCTMAAPRSMGGDLFIAGGEMCDGGVWATRAREQVTRIQLIPNLAPIRDLLVLPAIKSKAVSGFPNRGSSDRVFVARGKDAGLGRLSEMRHALDAQVVWDLEYPDALSIDHLWALECVSKQKLLLLMSHASHTSVLALNLQTQDIEAIDERTWPGLNYDTVTHAAAVVFDEIVVQFTASAIHLIDVRNTTEATVIQHTSGNCMYATVDDSSGFFAAIFQSASTPELRVGFLSRSENGSINTTYAADHYALNCQPLSIYQLTLADQRFVLVGTESGDVVTIKVNPEDGSLTPLVQRLSELYDGLVTAPITSILAVRNSQSVTYASILCGTRNGYLLILKLSVVRTPNEHTVHVEACGQHLLGSTAVTVVLDTSAVASSVTSALCYCGSSIQRVRFYDERGTDYGLSSVLLSEQEDGTYMQPTINSVRHIPKLRSIEGPPGGLLIAATDTALLFSNMQPHERILARHAVLQGTPRKMTYSSYLGRLIVGLDCRKHGTPPSPSTAGKAGHSRPGLQLVSPGEDSTQADGRDKSELLIIGDYCEHVTSITNWTPTDDHQHYEMIVVGLTLDGSSKTSRLAYISAKNLLRNSDARIKTIAKYPNKSIHSLAAFLTSSLVVCVGNDLILITLDLSTRKWSTVSTFPLPSPATSLQTQGSYILAATSHHSAIVVRFETSKTKLLFHGHDIRARQTSSCITFGNSNMMLACTDDVNTTLRGYQDFRAKRFALPQFEATLPLLVDHVAPFDAMFSREATRHRFIGASIDATIFEFTTLSECETKLLKFLENLVQPKRKNTKGLRMELRRLTRQYEDLDIDGEVGGPEGGHVHDPADMYVKGDVLASMLEPGPRHLGCILPSKIKAEIDDAEMMLTMSAEKEKDTWNDFEGLAKDVVGECEDYVGTVVAWLRRLLQYQFGMTTQRI